MRIGITVGCVLSFMSLFHAAKVAELVWSSAVLIFLMVKIGTCHYLAHPVDDV